MVTTDSTGILTNTPNIIDAVSYKADGAEIIYNEKYINGRAVTSSKPSLKLFDTGVIAEGVFAGNYAIGFYFDSTSTTTQGQQIMRVEIYEDGVLMDESIKYYAGRVIYEYDLNWATDVHTHGLFIHKQLKANKTYQIIVKTAGNLTSDAIIDYITFDRIASISPFDGLTMAAKASQRNLSSTLSLDENGSELVHEVMMGTLLGDIDPGDTYSALYTPFTTFKTVVAAYADVVDGYGNLNCNFAGTTDLGSIRIYIKNVGGSTWSKEITDTANKWYKNMRILIIGYI